MQRLLRFALGVALCSSALLAATDRIVDRVDLNRFETIRGQRHSLAVPQNDRGMADPAAQLSYATLVLQPGPGLDAFLASQQTPGSPDYRRWLTPEQFGDRFGLTANDISQLVAWLQGAGLRVHDVARGRHWITFSGSVEQVGHALHTEFHRYQVNGEMHVANAGDPSVPAAFAGVIAGFLGLNDFTEQSMMVPGTPEMVRPEVTSGSSHYLAPDDFATIYDLKPLHAAGIDGTGVSIAVVGRSDINLADIRTFRSTFNLPANDPQIVLFGPDPGHNSTDETEADLDVEWSGAVARGAKIIYVNAVSVTTSAQYAIDQNLAPIMTFSFGGCEQDGIALRPMAQQANAQGITWMASGGDYGAASCDGIYSPTPQASLGPTGHQPSSFPEITAVGGTQFNEGSAASTYWAGKNDANSASALSYIPETVWNGYSTTTLKDAGGGAPSALYAKPWWQIGTLDDKVRDSPDISLTASAGHDGYLIGTTASLAANAFAIVGGTSASSPSFAGIVALLNQYLVQQKVLAQPGLGNINPMLYRLAQSTTDVFHDTTTGDNKEPCVQGSPQCVDGMMGFSASPGYDLATGLGSVDANNLITEWNNGTASQTALAADSTTITDLGATMKLTATVTGGGKALPTGTVTFTTSDNTIATATLAPSADGASATASASVPAALLAYSGTVYAMYSGDAVYDGSSGMATLSLKIPAGGHSLVVPFLTPATVPLGATGWTVKIALAEKAGVATTLTGATWNGHALNLSFFSSTQIPAKGSISTTVVFTVTTFPEDVTFIFQGQDADGTAWTQQATVTFANPLGTYLLPAIGLTSTPAAVQQNPQADAACQWKQDLVLEEHAGYLMQLTTFRAGATDLTSQIQQIFGTTRLAPYGTLKGSLCWGTSNTAAGSPKVITMIANAPTGVAATSNITVQYQAAPAATAVFTSSADHVDLTVADNAHNAGATINLAFGGGTPAWQAAVVPANPTTSWLKLTPLSGSGAGQVNLQANTAGLSPGAYMATVAISGPGAVPDHLSVPVTLVVGASPSASIAAVVNAASYQQVAAPGMLAAVYGSGLSTAKAQAQSIPLPLALSGVSATVNGIAAPIVGTFPDAGQINIQIPYEAGSGPAVLAVNTNGQIASYPFTIAAAAPGLFGIWDAAGKPATSVTQGQTVIAYITGDGDVVPTLATGATPASTTAVKNLPKPRLPLSVTIGGEDVGSGLLFWGIPSGITGATQINFTVPADAPLGHQPVIVTVGGIASNPVTVNVTAAQ